MLSGRILLKLSKEPDRPDHIMYPKVIIILFLVSLLIRLIVLWMLPAAHLGTNAVETYLGGAYKIINGTGFSDSSYPVFTPPLYAILIAASFSLFGESLIPIKIAQCFVDSLTVVMVFLIAKRMFGIKTALLSGAILTIYPFTIFTNIYIGTETLFTFLLSIVVLCSLYAIEYDKWRYYWAAGAVLGIATLTRGTTQFYPLFFFLTLFAMGKVSRLILLKSLAFCLAFALVILPWTLRNYVVLKTFIPVATTGSVFLQGSSEKFLTIEGKWKEEPEYLKLLESRGLKRPPEGKAYEMDQFLFRAGIETYKIRFENEPLSIVPFMIKKFLRLWYATESGANHGKILAINLLIYLWAICGIWLALRSKETTHFIILGLIIYFVLLHWISLPLFRYMVPVMPYIIAYAAFAVNVSWEKISKRIELAK